MRGRTVLACLGLFMIGLASVTFKENTPFPSYFALLPVVGTGFILIGSDPSGIVGRFLSIGPLVGLGLISYSAYLWHQPIFAFARIKMGADPGFEMMAVLTGVALILAYIIWKFIETPFRNRRESNLREWPRPLLTAAIAMVAVAGVGFTGYKTNLQQSHFVKSLATDDLRLFEFIDEHTNYDLYDAMEDDTVCRFWVKDPEHIDPGRLQACQNRFGQAIIVLGDSHAMNVYHFFYRTYSADFVIGISQGGCRPHDTLPTCHLERSIRFLATHQEFVDVVYYHQSGSHLLRDENGNNDTYAIFDPDKSFTIDVENISSVMYYLTRLAEDNRVIWLGPFAEARVDFRDRAAVSRSGFKIDTYNFEIFDRLDAYILTAIQQEPTAYAYISVTDILDMDEDSLVVDGCLTFRDGDHFSRCGESVFGAKLIEHLSTIQTPVNAR